jgi:hypothetical protein
MKILNVLSIVPQVTMSYYRSISMRICSFLRRYIRITLFISLGFLAFIVSGCEEVSKIAKLEQDLLETKSEIEKIDQKILFKELEEKAVTLNLGDKGFAPLKFNLGIIVVSLENIESYGNGSKVTINFGNIQSATIVGLKATLTWNKVKGQKTDVLYNEKQISLNKDLLPGRWTKISVILEHLPPKDFEFLSISDLSSTGIKLATPFGLTDQL